MTRYEFHLSIPPEKYVEYYRGTVRHVVARALSGQNVQFPASLLQKFVSPEGVAGRFALTVDAHNKVVSLERV
ncbi:MAG: DUF2835 domain-containing protein [Opitutus sp.]|nr:DUF2835 domain-containing protein [Opitutus sp.]